MLRKQFILTLFFVIIYLNQFSQEGKLQKAKESLTSEKLPITTEVVAVASTSKSTIKNPFLQLIRNVIAYTAYALVIESPFEFKSKMHYAEIANYPYGKQKMVILFIQILLIITRQGLMFTIIFWLKTKIYMVMILG